MGRVSLLILVTGLFAAAWSSDHEPVRSNQHDVPRREYSPEAVHQTVLRRWKQPADQASFAQEQWIPTPNIPAGTYLVVDRQGRSERVVILATLTNLTKTLASGEHFLAEFQGERCHWIRLADEAADSLPIAAEPTEAIQR